MHIPFLASCMLAAVLGGALAQTPAQNPAPQPTVLEPSVKINGITVTHSGSFTGPSTSRLAEAGQDSPTHTVGTLAHWNFISDSANVDGKVGRQFGIEFRLDGEPADAPVTLHVALSFPPQGIRNPNTGAKMETARIAFPDMKIGALCLVGYGFDNAWEIVPGEWKIEIIYHDGSLAERTFTVTRPE